MPQFVLMELDDEVDLRSFPDEGVVQLCAADSLATALAGFYADRSDATEAAAVLLRRRRHREPVGALPFRRLVAGIAPDADADWSEDDLADLPDAADVVERVPA